MRSTFRILPAFTRTTRAPVRRGLAQAPTIYSTSLILVFLAANHGDARDRTPATLRRAGLHCPNTAAACPYRGNFTRKVTQLNWRTISAKSNKKSVYGKIDIQESACADNFSLAEEAVAAIVKCPESEIPARPSYVRGIFGGVTPFCCDVPFRGELGFPTAIGTGSIIAENHLLTARHVVMSGTSLAGNMCAVFGWHAHRRKTESCKTRAANPTTARHPRRHITGPRELHT
jgi:hypothetical protein